MGGLGMMGGGYSASSSASTSQGGDYFGGGSTIIEGMRINQPSTLNNAVLIVGALAALYIVSQMAR